MCGKVPSVAELPCPECGSVYVQVLQCAGAEVSRCWGDKTFLVCRVSRVGCPEHCVATLPVPRRGGWFRDSGCVRDGVDRMNQDRFMMAVLFHLGNL